MLPSIFIYASGGHRAMGMIVVDLHKQDYFYFIGVVFKKLTLCKCKLFISNNDILSDRIDVKRNILDDYLHDNS